MTGRFDGCCPYCEKKIEAIYDAFVASDYGTEFAFECPHCEKTIAVDVHTVPEFELTKLDSIPPRDRWGYR